VQVAADLAANFGIPIFWCDDNKQPLTKHGFKDATTDLAAIERDYQDGALLAFPTGAPSKITVLDVDPNGAEWYRENADYLTCARIHQTRRGHHLLYRWTDGVRNSAGRVAPGVDVRGEGGYAIYWPAHGLEAVGDLEDIAAPPQWLLEKIAAPAAPTAKANGTGKVAAGERHAALLKVASQLRRTDLTGDGLEAALLAWNADHCDPPQDAADVRRIAQDFTAKPRVPAQESQTETRAIRKASLDWSALESQTPPERDWIEEKWLGAGYVTLLAGAPGTGKTGLAQAWGSCLALGHSYLDWVPRTRTVLMWAAEDDEGELWRRQIAIAKALNVPLSSFAPRLHLKSYDGEQCELAGLIDQRLVGTSMLTELREQIGDHKADVVVLDNIARLYGGNENDRHQVSSFIAMLRAAGMATNAGILLLGHPGKAPGSEWSGSTAWEGAVRSRLYLGYALPDAAPTDDEAPPDDSIRYLCRRKANYSARDWRQIRFTDGVMVPAEAPEGGNAPSAKDPAYTANVVANAVRKLSQMDMHGTASRGSPLYLPKLAKHYGLIENLTERQFAAGMREMQLSGTLAVSVVGKYPNRTPKRGLTLVESMS
jgi:RecA-family ATPase